MLELSKCIILLGSPKTHSEASEANLWPVPSDAKGPSLLDTWIIIFKVTIQLIQASNRFVKSLTVR